MKRHSFLALDLGATSGRAVCGTLVDGEFEMREIYRFPNSIFELQGKFYWNIYKLLDALKESLRVCAKENIQIDSIGIDTWGVDFGYISEDGTLLSLPRAYRDPYTDGVQEELFEKISREEIYELTGIQFMNFNSIFQLFRARKQNFGPVNAASHILFMPDLLSYLLTDKMIWEYTHVSTSQLLNPVTNGFEKKLFDAIDVSFDLVGEVTLPGTLIGTLSEEVQKETGIGPIPVVAVAGHDTASAVAAVPAMNKEFAYLSSGTWSLMGIETDHPIISEKSCQYNFTNEGGIEGTTRFLKNITGMWILEQCRKEWEKENRVYEYEDIIRMSEDSLPFQYLIDPDDPSFANPKSMIKAIQDYCKKTGQPVPQEDKEIIRCIFESLALKYREVINVLQDFAPFAIDCLHVIGGGSRNKLLNQMTANAIQRKVIAGPSEATAIGNCMIQAKSAGIVKDRWDMRKLIASFIPLDVFMPNNKEEWDCAYEKYNKIINFK